MKEIYKTIPFATLYEISNFGVVRNKKTGRVLKLRLNAAGYYRVNLSGVEGNRTFTIHRLVACTFLGLKDGFVVNHKDCNRLNNSLENLEWITQIQNLKYKPMYFGEFLPYKTCINVKYEWNRIKLPIFIQ